MEQRSRRGALSLMLGAAATPALAVPTPPPPLVPRARPGVAEGYKDTTEVATKVDPVTRMTAPVRIDGRTSAQFMVDTGADRTTISRELADALGLQAGDPVLLHSVAGPLETMTARIPLLEVGSRQFKDVIAPVLPRADLGAEGLLGIDSLKDQRLLLDFKQARMAIMGGRHYPVDGDEVVIKAKSRFGQLTLVDAWLEGEPIIVIVDSGAQSSIANDALRARVQRLRKPVVTGDIEVVSVTGQSAWGDGAVIPRLKLGGFTIRNMPVIYADLHTFHRWGIMDEPAMLLGVDVLRKFDSIWIDFVRREVRFRFPTWSDRLA